VRLRSLDLIKYRDKFPYLLVPFTFFHKQQQAMTNKLGLTTGSVPGSEQASKQVSK
jgi:hypothetical protein